MILKDKHILITGASSGIGKAIANRFLQEGAFVLGIGSQAHKGQILEQEFAHYQERFSFVQCDVSKPEEIKNFFTTHQQTFDILVNNAGITRDGLMMKMSLQDWQDVQNVNIQSYFLMSQGVCRPMIKARSGRIINISSVVGLCGNAGQTNYAAAKAAIIGFSKSLAKELATRNILVNCIAPGFISTAMTQDLDTDSIISQIPLQRMGSVEDIAQAALFLASPMSSYMTGQVLVIDGGLHM